MPSTSKRRSPATRKPAPLLPERQTQRRALKLQLRIERDVRRLTKQLQREIQRSNDALQALGIALASRSRALEAERESAAALHA